MYSASAWRRRRPVPRWNARYWDHARKWRNWPEDKTHKGAIPPDLLYLAHLPRAARRFVTTPRIIGGAGGPEGLPWAPGRVSGLTGRGRHQTRVPPDEFLPHGRFEIDLPHPPRAAALGPPSGGRIQPPAGRRDGQSSSPSPLATQTATSITTARLTGLACRLFRPPRGTP